MGLGNKIRVVLDSTYQEKIRFASGVELFQDTVLNHEQKTTLWGTVVYVPTSKAECLCNDCSNGKPCIYSERGVSETVMVGDKVCFRYDVVADGDIAQDGSGRKHTNLIHIDGKPQWMVDYRQLFMIERDGKQQMVGGYIKCDHVYHTNNTSGKGLNGLTIEIPKDFQQTSVPYHLKVVSVNDNSKGVVNGDTVLINPAIVQHYNFTGVFGQDNAIVQLRHVQAKLIEQ